MPHEPSDRPIPDDPRLADLFWHWMAAGAALSVTAEAYTAARRAYGEFSPECRAAYGPWWADYCAYGEARDVFTEYAREHYVAPQAPDEAV